jgi:hypothetical protein
MIVFEDAKPLEGVGAQVYALVVAGSVGDWPVPVQQPSQSRPVGRCK